MWGGHSDRADLSVWPRLAWFAVLTFALPVQAALAPILSIGGAVPDIPLLSVVLFALFHGRFLSAAVGAGVGVGLDLFAAGQGPFHLVAYAALAVTASSVGRLTATVRTWTVVAFVALSSLALGVGHMIWGGPMERADELAHWVATRLAPQAFYDTTVGWMLFAAWRWRYPPPRDGLGERDEFFSARRLQGLIR